MAHEAGGAPSCSATAGGERATRTARPLGQRQSAVLLAFTHPKSTAARTSSVEGLRRRRRTEAVPGGDSQGRRRCRAAARRAQEDDATTVTTLRATARREEEMLACGASWRSRRLGPGGGASRGGAGTDVGGLRGDALSGGSEFIQGERRAFEGNIWIRSILSESNQT